MDFAIRNAPGVTELHLRGRLTFADHEVFRSALAALAGPAAHGVVVDLTALEFLDSSGIGMLIVARDAALRRGRAFTLRAGPIGRLPALARFQTLFTITG